MTQESNEPSGASGGYPSFACAYVVHCDEGYWRGGHSGNKYYGPVRGFGPLEKAKLFASKSDAVAQAGKLRKCRVSVVTIQVGAAVYPPSAVGAYFGAY